MYVVQLVNKKGFIVDYLTFRKEAHANRLSKTWKNQYPNYTILINNVIQ